MYRFRDFDVEEYRELEIYVRDHSRSFKVAPFDRPHTSS